MKTIAEFIKELIYLLIMIEVGAFVFRLLLSSTLIGRILLTGKRNSKGYLKNRLNVWKLRAKRTKKIIIFIKNVGCNIYVKLDKRFEVAEEENSEIIVNGGKIIDFNTAKELRYKWNK